MNAPRVLNEPACWKSSSLKTTGPAPEAEVGAVRLENGRPPDVRPDERLDLRDPPPVDDAARHFNRGSSQAIHRRQTSRLRIGSPGKWP